MPEQSRASDRPGAARAADHAELARLADTLVPALVAKLTSSGLGEVEIHEGTWKVRVRRNAAGGRRAGSRSAAHAPSAPSAPAHAPKPAAPAAPERVIATAPTVGVFRPSVHEGATVRSGDRIGTVDLLGIPQDVVAPIDGVLVELYIKAGEAVEYGEDVAAFEPPAPPKDADADADPGAVKGGEG